jgi:hypothetical protein
MFLWQWQRFRQSVSHLNVRVRQSSNVPALTLLMLWWHGNLLSAVIYPNLVSELSWPVGISYLTTLEIYYLKDQGVGFPGDDASFLGYEFVKNLTYTVFPLNQNVWTQLNDKHNRRCEPPHLEFAVFFGRKVKGHRADRPCLISVVQHLQELWIGMGKP